MVLTSLLISQAVSDIKDDLELLFTHGSVGNGQTVPVASDTALEAEDFRDAIDDFDKSISDKVIASLRILTTENNGNSVSETGWFDAAAAGNMWTRNTLTAINKTSDIQIFLDTSITIKVVEGS